MGVCGATETVKIGPGDALIIVDVQRDFLPGGALAVPAGDEVVQPLKRAMDAFAGAGLPVFQSRDWHPPDHCSFKSEGGPWPPHCVAGTPGARFAPGLEAHTGAVVISKATRPDQDAYSAFQGTTLERLLQKAGVRRLVVGGLATDYCVKATVRDAITHGLEVIVLIDAVRAVELTPGDGRRALREMHMQGARLTTSDSLAVSADRP